MIDTFAIIPAVDVLDGRAVRLRRGDYDRVATEGGDPFELIARVAAARPPLVHVVALGAARDGGAPIDLARRAVAAAAPVPVQLGGGVRSVADALALVGAGVDRVMVGTAAFGPIPLESFVEVLGDRLVVAVDVAGGIVRTAGWLESSSLTTAAALARCTEAGVTRVLCTAIDRDGTLRGPSLGPHPRGARPLRGLDPRRGRHPQRWPTSTPCGSRERTEPSSGAPGSRAASTSPRAAERSLRLLAAA